MPDMVRSALTRVFLILSVSAPLSLSAQGGNPYEGDRTAIRAGAALYGTRCAECHGADAKGISGPDLTLMWASGTSDDRVFQVIRRGVSGSIMRSSSAPDREIWAVVAYVKGLSTVPPFENDTGAAERGQEVFSSTCARCHRVNRLGGRLGPALSRVAATRSPGRRSCRAGRAASSPGPGPTPCPPGRRDANARSECRPRTPVAAGTGSPRSYGSWSDPRRGRAVAP